jgi:hypothetical protein
MLLAWLSTVLRARGGVYYLRRADAIKSLPPGSVVLFRYGNDIVGEAVVWKDKEPLSATEKGHNLLGKDVTYAARITFLPSSIRIYAPPLPVECLRSQTEKDLTTYAGAYVELEWSAYSIVLQEVASRSNLIV